MKRFETGRRCAIAALVLTAACAAAHAANRPDPSSIEGKVLFGYQGWFDCPSDGGTESSWRSWAHGAPSAATLTVDMYPDLKEFGPKDLCAVPGMTIGERPAYLFSTRNPRVVAHHFRWMQDYGLDGVLVQRFIGNTPRLRAAGDVVLKNIMAAAAESGRVFAIEYDISGGKDETFAQMLREDWTYLVDTLKVTAHPNYLRHKGKPLVGVWGMGLDEAGHPPVDAEAAKKLIRWFKSEAPPEYRAAYMGGVPARWRTLTADSRKEAEWSEVYRIMDIVQPWTVGRYRDAATADAWKTNMLEPDLKQARENGQIYMPVVFPGFSWANLMRRRNLPDRARENEIPRRGGEFFWRQVQNARAAGATVLKIAMFDEVNEGTAMFKLAARREDAPSQGYWLTLDADGKSLPSDWYLKLAGETTRLFHDGRTVPAAIPLDPSGAPRPLGESASRNIPTRDPSSIVKCKDEYWVFYTGRGVRSYRSKDLEKWEPGPAVFNSPPDWAKQAVPANRGMAYWAPDIMELDGRYLLYYSISSWGKITSAIGLATNSTLDPKDPAYRWKDAGLVVQSGEGGNFNAIDPAVFRDDDGSLWLVFGSYWSGIKLIQLDPKTGKRISPDSPMHSLAYNKSIEAAFIYKNDGYYYLFVNWDACCRGVRSTYNIRIGRSKTVTGPYLDKNGTDMLKGGGTLFLDAQGPLAGPGHAGILVDKGKTWFTSDFEGDMRLGGRPTLAIMPLRWNADGWPEAEVRDK